MYKYIGANGYKVTEENYFQKNATTTTHLHILT